jgi:ABC-type sugar transport system permease subunit
LAVATARARKVETVRSARLREALWGYGFVLVPMAVFLVFFIWPMAYAFYISAHDWQILGKVGYVGIDNYRFIWDDLSNEGLFYKGLVNTFRYTLFVVPAQMALGLLLALVVHQPIRARAFFRSAFYFPSLASSAAIMAIAIYLLNADGLVNAVLGTDQAWLGDSDTALESIMAVNVWTTSGTMMLFYLASLQSIPTDVYEAAAVDNAGTWRTFWKITFPLLKPGHFFVAVVSVIGCLKIFDQAYIASGGTGGPAYSTLTAVLYLYQVAIQDGDRGYAAAVGVVLFLIIFTVTLAQRLLFGRADPA